MADQNITALPKKTSSQMAATDYLLGIDSAEGYQMLIQDLGDYIIQHATSSLAGANQTLSAAINGLNSKLAFNGVEAIDDVLTWALTVNGFKVGITNASTSNVPEDNQSGNYGLVLCEAFHPNDSAIWIKVLWFPTTSTDIYVNSKTNNFAWLGWKKVPTRSEVDLLNSNSVPLKLLNKPSANTYTLNLPSNGRFMIVTVPNSATDMTLVLATVYGSGAVYINNLSGESNTSFTTGTNILTATTNTSSPVTFSVLVIALDKTVGVNGVTIS